uniref:Nucleoside phosphorylase domain-containing protein n=1 Tax=Pyramimonas obovata TaxID=1411642 RepID=A0A7S0WR43_9CHLO|eukprot:CAMPEP_0118922030 /NCGR_PEP_ID=MMETSP1169-20130426/1106_1 /TAXON_ID=36882 /ORGANISM="Pyramimonas obovata, Strain CCMP722" /LENGTH=247 /DNA_ID=CAMNT_0006862843 /DNA_START=50 /DNA_END=793 /DNA_ORIENTATION=+
MADKKIETVLVVIAMEAEAAPFVEHLKLTKDEPSLLNTPLPGISYSGTHGSTKVVAVCNGKDAIYGVDSVGTVSAALTTYAAIQAVKPDLVINAGTCGGFKAKGGAIGDVYLSSAFKNHDRRIPLPGFEAFGTYAVESPACPKLVAAAGLKVGVVSTGNSLDCTPTDAEVMKENDASVKEMEGAAIAQVAKMFGIPIIGIKSVTDIVDGDRPTGEEFMENLGAAAKALQDKLPKVIDFVAGKTAACL